MQRLFVIIIIALFSCRGTSSDKTQQVSDTTDTTSKMMVPQNKVVSCEQLLSDIVRSSNAVAFKHFNDTLVKARIDNLSAEKATIKLYVINDISETHAEKRLTEHAVGWLELYKPTGRLLDITNDAKNPLVLTYDTTLVQQHDFFGLCGFHAPIAKSDKGYERRDIMFEDDIRFNGRLKRFFTLDEFEKVFGQPDSVKLLVEEAPCITIFDTEAPDDKYLYKNGSRFETSGSSVAVDEFWFANGDYITYKGKKIDAGTTISGMKKLFPDAVVGRINEYREGELSVMVLKEGKEGISDGHIKLFFKNGKVYFMHWWLPC